MARYPASTDTYIRRFVDTELDVLFDELPAILLDGPRAVGKTATAARRCPTAWYLDDPLAREALASEPHMLESDRGSVLVDEWQRVPSVWDVVRRVVDERRRGSQFLLTGSVPPAGVHSGAGRIVTLRMRPMCLAERLSTPSTVSIAGLLGGHPQQIMGTSQMTLGDYVDEIMTSGFPGIRGLGAVARNAALDGYLDRIVEHDLGEAGFVVRRPAALRSWMRAYAAATGTSAAWERIRDSATAGLANKPAKTTTLNYTELLTEMRVLDPLDAWLPGRNHFARLASSPKHHIADPALAVRLLKCTRAQLLRGEQRGIPVPRDGLLLGNLFESLAALTIRAAAQAARANVAHLRTRNGDHEVDFIVEGDEGIVAFEVKLSGSVDDHDVRHLLWLRNQIGDDLLDSVVVTTGPMAYRRQDGVAVVPLALLGA